MPYAGDGWEFLPPLSCDEAWHDEADSSSEPATEVSVQAPEAEGEDAPQAFSTVTLGTENNDRIDLSAAAKQVDGRAGSDTVVTSAPRREFTASPMQIDDAFTLLHQTSGERWTLADIEFVEFSDGVFSREQLLAQTDAYFALLGTTASAAKDASNEQDPVASTDWRQPIIGNNQARSVNAEDTRGWRQLRQPRHTPPVTDGTLHREPAGEDYGGDVARNPPAPLQIDPVPSDVDQHLSFEPPHDSHLPKRNALAATAPPPPNTLHATPSEVEVVPSFRAEQDDETSLPQVASTPRHLHPNMFAARSTRLRSEMLLAKPRNTFSSILLHTDPSLNRVESFAALDAAREKAAAEAKASRYLSGTGAVIAAGLSLSQVRWLVRHNASAAHSKAGASTWPCLDPLAVLRRRNDSAVPPIPR